jgi:RNA polymerase sigma-70 factor (ECF subfamily)
LNQDLQILRRIARKDKKAFSQLYKMYAAKVYNTALSYAQSVEDAEEITQDVFVKIHRSAAKFKGNSSVNTWIYRIAVNTSLDYLKRKKRLSIVRFDKVIVNKPDFEHPGVLLENKEKAKMLFKVIDTLPETQKTAFILSFIEELPRKEVAKIMQTSLKAVEGLLQRGKNNLRKKLEKEYPNRKKKK